MSEDLDLDGYPTHEALNKIRFWLVNDIDKVRELISFVERIWRLCEPRREIVDDDEGVVFCTGGWSGNESIVEALEDNVNFMDRCWYASFRGGKHIFVIK